MTSEFYQKVDVAVDTIAGKIKGTNFEKPLVLIICGSGLGGIAKILQGHTVEIPYSSIPGFKRSTVPGHTGSLLFGTIGTNSVPVMCMVGRLHFYEGYTFEEATFPVRVAAAVGVKYLIATNACGYINDSFHTGELMVINDHLNLPGIAGNNPLRGPNLDRYGPRFPPMGDAYDLELRIKFFNAAKETGVSRTIQEGVYTFVSGPSFETRAECRMLRLIGADVVGMSTVPEVIVGRHSGLRCFGLSLITNPVSSDVAISGKDASAKGLTVQQALAAAPHDEELSHAEVLAEGQAASFDVNTLMEAFVNTLE